MVVRVDAEKEQRAAVRATGSQAAPTATIPPVAAHLLALQRTVGNRAVARAVQAHVGKPRAALQRVREEQDEPVAKSPLESALDVQSPAPPANPTKKQLRQSRVASELELKDLANLRTVNRGAKNTLDSDPSLRQEFDEERQSSVTGKTEQGERLRFRADLWTQNNAVVPRSPDECAAALDEAADHLRQIEAYLPAARRAAENYRDHADVSALAAVVEQLDDLAARIGARRAQLAQGDSCCVIL